MNSLPFPALLQRSVTGARLRGLGISPTSKSGATFPGRKMACFFACVYTQAVLAIKAQPPEGYVRVLTAIGRSA